MSAFVFGFVMDVLLIFYLSCYTSRFDFSLSIIRVRVIFFMGMEVNYS
jgi:hypothetical protein